MNKSPHQNTQQAPKAVSEKRLMAKIRTSLSLIGRATVLQALTLYYTMRAPDTPVWCRSVALASLGYFISLIDGIPDLTPVLGYTDDVSVMAAAIATIAIHITPKIKQQAEDRTKKLFKEPAQPS